MSEEPSMIPKDDPLVRPYSKKQFFLTVVLWVLLGGTLFWAFFRVKDKETMVVALLLLFFIRILATYWREKFNAIMRPRHFMDWLHNTIFYQIFAMAMKQQWSAAWIWFSVIPMIFLVVFFRTWIEPVLDLDQMVMTNAYIEKIIDNHKAGTRFRGSDLVYIVKENGERLKLASSFIEKEMKILNELKDNKEKVTIWYQNSGSLYKNKICQIKKNEEMIKEYHKERGIKIHNFDKAASIFLLSYFIFTVFFIVKFYMKKINKMKNMGV